MGGARWRVTFSTLIATALLVAGLIGPSLTQAIVRQSGGGSSFLVLGSSGPGREVAAYEIAVVVRGGVSIRFHADRRAGCQRYGLCGYRGELALRPDGVGEVLLTKYRRHHRGRWVAVLFPDLQGPTGFDVHVTRSSRGRQHGLCADESLNSLFPSGSARAGHPLTLRLVQPADGQLAGRCAGPMGPDIAPVSPRASFRVRRLMHPGSTISLLGTRRFSSHGFMGTISSTIVVHVGKNRRGPTGFGQQGGKTRRIRIVTERLEIVRTTGGFRAEFHGVRAPGLCRLVDSCGLRGRLTWSAVPAHVTATLTASGLASHPLRDFRAALGLSDGHVRGIGITASVSWSSGGSLTERVTRTRTCTDTVGLGSGAISLYGARFRVGVFYEPGGSLRTRCPGPLLDEAPGFGLGETIRARRLRRSSFTLHLRPGRSTVEDGGYVTRVSGRLLVVLRRSGRIRQHEIRVPADAVGFYAAPRAPAG